MNFKDMLDSDLDLFFNPNEVGEVVNFGGSEMVVVKSSSTFSKKFKGQSDETGIYKGGITFSVRKSDLLIPPEPQDNITIDNTRYEVLDIEDAGNTYRIDLITHRR